jgi:glutamine synthetase
MYEALVEAEGSSFLQQALGDETYHNFMSLKTREWEVHRTHVTSREISMYLDR